MKVVYWVILCFIVFGIGFAGWFWWMNLRGLGPALLPIPENISDVFEPGSVSSSQDAVPSTKNLTSFPLHVPSGMMLSLFAKNLGAVRDLFFEPIGDAVLASVPSKGVIIALRDTNHDGVAEEQKTILAGLHNPHGIAVAYQHDGCQLFIAEEARVMRYEYDCAAMIARNPQKLVDLLTGGLHWTRSLLLHDGKLLISIGSSCNVCIEKNSQRAAVLSVGPDGDGSDLKLFARGLRNAVFLAENPNTHEVWVTENGRDLLGDDLPPDEINILQEGKNYGWPNCYGQNVHDTAFDKNTYIRNPCMEPFERSPKVELQAHSAPLGLAFFPPEWPEEYRTDLLVAFHGSWNRTSPTGYKLYRIKLDAQGNVIGQEDFMTGWLTSKNQALGRPVDVLFHGRELFISDDKAGVVYRLTP